MQGCHSSIVVINKGGFQKCLQYTSLKSGSGGTKRQHLENDIGSLEKDGHGSSDEKISMIVVGCRMLTDGM